MSAKRLTRDELRALPTCRPPGAWVYVLDCDHGVKVGLTKLGMRSRLGDFERGMGFRPMVAGVWAFEKREGAWEVEQGAHHLLRGHRRVGEWFHCHPFEAVAAVRHCVRYGRPFASVLGITEEEAAEISRRFMESQAA